jgi:molybdenum cofactor guanylyltransferase
VRSVGQVPELEFPDFDTIVLAGGKAARMAGADKPGLEVGGTAMIVAVARAAAAAGAGRLVIVGPDRGGDVRAGLSTVAAGLPGGVIRVREEPPGAGPVAALRRGLAEVTAPWLALLAADLPFLADRHLADLLAAGSRTGALGVVLADDDGRPQWLVGVWQAGPLRVGLAAYGGNSLGGLLAPLGPALLRLPAAGAGPAPWLDCDTPQELAAARAAIQTRAEVLGGAEVPAGIDSPGEASSLAEAEFLNGAP